jgi:hypothetical protein
MFNFFVHPSCHSEILPWTIGMQKEPLSSWMFIIPAIQKYYPDVWSMFRDTTLMYDPYAKRIPFFLNVYHSCHSQILPWCMIRIQKDSRSSWMFIIPAIQRCYPDVRSTCRDNTLMYNLYSKVKKNTVLRCYWFELDCKYLIFYGTVDIVQVMLVSWSVRGTILASYFPLPRTVMDCLQRGKRPSIKPNPLLLASQTLWRVIHHLKVLTDHSNWEARLCSFNP